MSILVAIMIPSPFTRLITTWVTIAVVILHGMTVWAMISVDSSRPLEPVNIPKAIQIELIKEASLSNKSSIETPSAEPQPNTAPPKTVLPKTVLPKIETPKIETSKQQTDETIKESEPTTSSETKSPETLAVSESIKPLKTKVDKKLLSGKTSLNKTSSKDKEPKTDATSSIQSLTTVETRKIVRLSDELSETEDDSEVDDDLSAMIRAVTAQFNREQAIQKRSAENQSGRKQAERERWRVQAANDSIAKMLALAADQAAQQDSDQAELDTQTDKNKAVLFAADDGRWIEGSEPTTGVPSLVWRNVSTGLGDIFIVMLELHVNKEGYVTEVQVLESSGSPIIDAIATTQVRAGQLNPLKDNGIVVDAIVPMSLVYERS
ncbi:energy transducer TonB [Psychrobacter sp. SWN149]|uniref:energy transducer TonB n=1 Tax=Psychrobacter sp. SWN149 TaxID=2792057 RepID=UPI0018CF05DF|nr:energy transducer TonB [Psychrobacter sp. SWN149]MBH0006095.1 energy transducer TonB [Psychrobacter sp. SWN149]